MYFYQETRKKNGVGARVGLHIEPLNIYHLERRASNALPILSDAAKYCRKI